MCHHILTTLLFTASVVRGLSPCLSLVSWADPRVDLFGVGPDFSIWHKFYTGWDWQPANSFERLPSSTVSCPLTTSWGEGRLDILYIDDPGNVLHKYFSGDAWGPSWEGAEDLGGEVDAIASASWGADRLDIVTWAVDGPYAHKAWTGKEWYPAVKEWEDFGGDFSSPPAVVSWGTGRFDIIGISASAGSILHKYYDHGWSEWEDLGGGPFVGTPVATSWGPGRMDFWAIDEEGALNHLFWDGSQYQGWETLGGSFSDTPKVVHWTASKTDIVGRDRHDGKYWLKTFDGGQWRGWYELSGPFVSEPEVLAKRETNFLYVFGIEETGSLRMQIWTGYDWQPGFNQTWALGDLSNPYPEASSENQAASEL